MPNNISVFKNGTLAKLNDWTEYLSHYFIKLGNILEWFKICLKQYTNLAAQRLTLKILK